MASTLLLYVNGVMRTTKFPGHFRSLAWDSGGQTIFVVGNGGRMLRISEDNTLTSFDTKSRQNLRGLSINYSDGSILVVGNSGTVLLLDKQGNVSNLNAQTSENLRAVSWNPEGTEALIAGNNGALLRYADHTIESVDDGGANLRHISWHPKTEQALITSNCFAEEFIPSPNLLAFDANKNSVTPLNEGRNDLIGVDWKPNGESAIVVGYDVVWHSGFIGIYDGASLSSITFENKRVYPVTVSWKSRGNIAALGTATTQPGISKGNIILWNGESLKTVYSTDEFFFSTVAWDPEGDRLATLASSATRTFNC